MSSKSSFPWGSAGGGSNRSVLSGEEFGSRVCWTCMRVERLRRAGVGVLEIVFLLRRLNTGGC